MADKSMSDALLNQRPGYRYSLMLPIKYREHMDVDQLSTDYMKGDMSPAMFGIIADMYNSMVKSGQMMMDDRELDPGELFMNTLDFAPGALAVGRLAPKGATLGMFAGSGAKTADLPMDEASRMAKREEITALRAEANANRDDWAGIHRPPMRDSGAPAHDLTGGGTVYPDDVYSPNAVQYYGTGNKAMDRETVQILNKLKNNPDKMVSIYRAVPPGVKGSEISAGDWVTVNRNYAKDHGESALRGDYVIIERRVPARDIYTNGDSIHEFGFDPSRESMIDTLR